MKPGILADIHEHVRELRRASFRKQSQKDSTRITPG
jgi:hypothetical protein